MDINKKTVQFLFPDLDPEGIVIPLGKGTGLEIIDQGIGFETLDEFKSCEEGDKRKQPYTEFKSEVRKR